MVERTLNINNKFGLHARPASNLVSLTSKFKSNIYISKGEKKVNAKSLLAVLSLGVSYGDEVKITINGEDEIDAMDKLTELINSGLGE